MHAAMSRESGSAAARGGRGIASLAVWQGKLGGAVIPADLLLAPADYPILTLRPRPPRARPSLRDRARGTHRLPLTQALLANGVECDA